MKKILIFSLLVLFSCSPSSTVPGSGKGPGGGHGREDERVVSVAYLKTLYTGAPTLITSELYIDGTVISSDDQGNFYHTLVLEDATGGIEVKLGMDQIFKLFRLHSLVQIRCNGLWLGSYGGTLQLGSQPFEDYETEPLSETQIAEHLVGDNTFYGEVIPRTLTFSELSLRHVSTFVAFEGVSFVEQGVGWSKIDADTNRHLIDSKGNTLAVRTSRYARFASWVLPADVGRIEGVLGYFNGDYQLVVTDSQRFYAR